jgi:putative ABC transport system permease protein
VNALKQIAVVTAVAIEALPRRLGTSLIVVIGTATTVAVLISALAIARGFTGAATQSGSPNRAIVLGGTNESSSAITRADAAIIMDAPGVEHGPTGAPIASAETLLTIAFTDFHTGQDASLPIRGIGLQAFALRPETKLIAGRRFEPGRRELIVGRSLEARVGGLTIGSEVKFPDGNWKVVGIFSSGGGPYESELLADVSSVMNAFGQSSFNDVTVRLTNPTAFAQFNAALTSTPTLTVKPLRESEFYAAMSGPLSRLLDVTAYGLGFIMAFGAVFGALNTMFSTVRARRTEIATLRAIGFGAPSVIASVVVEALLLGLIGALIGALAAWLIIDGMSISTMVATGTSLHVTFGLEVGWKIVMTGALFALGIASAAAVFAARQAARISIAAAMR